MSHPARVLSSSDDDDDGGDCWVEAAAVLEDLLDECSCVVVVVVSDWSRRQITWVWLGIVIVRLVSDDDDE